MINDELTKSNEIAPGPNNTVECIGNLTTLVHSIKKKIKVFYTYITTEIAKIIILFLQWNRNL